MGTEARGAGREGGCWGVLRWRWEVAARVYGRRWRGFYAGEGYTVLTKAGYARDSTTVCGGLVNGMRALVQITLIRDLRVVPGV